MGKGVSLVCYLVVFFLSDKSVSCQGPESGFSSIGQNTTLPDVNVDAKIQSSRTDQQQHSAEVQADGVLRPSQIKRTFDLLDRGEKEIILKQEFKDVVLVFGNTGSGKSTFTQWITGDGSNLTSVGVDEDSDEYIIVDSNNKISNSTIKSKTIFPDLFIDPETNTAFYDFPGFEDTRSTSNDIATSYFIKKVLENVKRIKMVFVISYPSVKKGVDRQGLMKLLRHATELVKHIDKFKNSFAVVITKVDKQNDKNGNILSDAKMIKKIANFLQEVKEDLTEGMKDSLNKDKNEISCTKSIKFIDILTEKDGVNYNRIGIFRRPNEAGVLSNISLLKEGHDNIKKIINETLTYTLINHGDFGHTISDKSKSDINDLKKEIHKNIFSCLRNITQKVLEDYMNLEYFLMNRIRSFIINNTINFNIALSEAETSSNKLTLVFEVISALIAQIKNEITPIELSYEVNKSLTSLDYNISIDTEFIKTQGQYLEFLQEIDYQGSKFSSSSLAWASAFQSVVTDIAESKSRIVKNASEASNKLDIHLTVYVTESKKKIKSLFTLKEKNNHNLKESYEQFSSALDKLLKTKKIVSVLSPQECTYEMISTLMKINVIPFNHTLLNKIKAYGTYLEYLNIITQSLPHLSQCAKQLDSMIENLDKSQKWYNFLLHLYEKMSKYEIQKNIAHCKILANEINDDDKGKNVSETGLDTILKDCCHEDKNLDYENVKNIPLDELKLETLKRVLTVTLKHGIAEINCDSRGQLTIKGHYVFLSDLLRENCSGSINRINIFALNKVFIDTSINKTGMNVQLSIIAPTWEVLGYQNIHLDGSRAKSIIPEKPFDGSGISGKPGLPGGPGGDFLGIGETFINSHGLTISVRGGDGGPGQNGGNGVNGKNGTIPYLPFTHEFVPIWSKGDFDSELTKNGFIIIEKNKVGFLEYVYHISGKDCTDGGNGGGGGHGGFGGRSGKNSLISLSSHLNISIFDEKGNEGKNGEGGLGGKPGHSGKLLDVFSYAQTIGFYPVMYIKYNDKGSENLKECSPGLIGTKINENGISFAENVQRTPHSFIINDYKMFLRENFNGVAMDSSIKDFLNKLENDAAVQDLYDILGFLNEMFGLEHQFYEFQHNFSFLPFYQSLLKRVNCYIENIGNRNINLSNQKVLSYLRVAISSKIYNIKNKLENYLVINIENYFTILEDHIKSYNLALKEMKIKTYKEEYYQWSLTQMIEADKLIKQIILPEIDKINQNMDIQINLLIQDVLNDQQKAIVEKEVLKKKQIKLANQYIFKFFLGYVKFTSQFLCFAGPEGAIAGEVLRTGADYLENSLLESPTAPQVSSVGKVMTQISDYRREQQNLKSLTNTEDSESKKSEANDELKETAKETAKKLALTGKDLYTKLNKDKSAIAALGDSIKEVNDKINQLKEYEQSIYDTLIPVRIYMENSLMDLEKSSSNKTHAQLDINKLKIQNTINDFRMQMEYMIQASDHSIKDKFLACIEKMQDRMLTMIQIYDRIQDCQDKVKLANYIADLSSDSKISDNSELNNAIDKLELISQSNLVLQEYDKASTAFKQYIFPFAGLYLDQLELSPNLESNNITILIYNAVSNVKVLRDSLKKDNAVIAFKPYSIYPDVRFDSVKRDKQEAPFFRWIHDTHKEELFKLLKGQEVTLTADIKKGVNLNAVKFREIGIRFILANATMQAEFDKQLSNYLVTLIHLGDSYYRCDDKYFIISHDAISMTHSVNQEQNGLHYYHVDDTYTRIITNPPMCSPYTTWKIRLSSIDKNIEQFNSLNKYTDQAIDLALEGRGQYVDLELNVCIENLDKYYKAI